METPKTFSFVEICHLQIDPEEFARGIFENMNRLAKRDSICRLIYGTDLKAPDYLIEEIMDTETGQSVVLEAFKGANHKPIKDFKKSEKLENGPRKIRVSWGEVQATLGKIREFQKKK